jgi:RimJ/RimL family protein N-acetyltransferase
MNQKLFVPTSFHPPLEVHIGQYLLRPLTEKHAKIDRDAVNSSIDLIRRTRGGTWPAEAISLEDDTADLIAHRQEFEQRSSFAYTVVDQDESECVGCVYIYPPNHPFDGSDKSRMPEDADAAVSFWVSQAAYEQGFYPVLRDFLQQWIKQEWPFKNVYYPNKEAVL